MGNQLLVIGESAALKEKIQERIRELLRREVPQAHVKSLMRTATFLRRSLAAAAAEAAPAVSIVRCQSPDEMLERVREHTAANGLLDRLDIVDHGRAGAMALGDHLLFRSDARPETEVEGAEIALELRAHMSPFAQLRLLGCQTARGEEGRMLLFKLQRLLDPEIDGDRIVFGTIRRVRPVHFEDDGQFKSAVVPTMLFSSLAALDGVAPLPDDRRSNVLAIAAQRQIQRRA
jgi:hypothetical protein